MDPGTAGVLGGTGVGLARPSLCTAGEESSAAAGAGIGLGMPSTNLESAELGREVDPCVLERDDAPGSANPLARTVVKGMKLVGA
jgi:hypothetical protein